MDALEFRKIIKSYATRQNKETLSFEFTVQDITALAIKMNNLFNNELTNT